MNTNSKWQESFDNEEFTFLSNKASLPSRVVDPSDPTKVNDQELGYKLESFIVIGGIFLESIPCCRIDDKQASGNDRK
jgi:hypothetical protein